MRLPLLLLAPLVLVPAAPAHADPLCYGVTVTAVTTTGVHECVPYDNLVACRTEVVSLSPVRVEVLVCQPRK
ncbi:MAG TPA: hypothetical protein VGX28_05010 [Frankiaceae bacterium]|jgi:hypothetical protein|nr:hypothetical protein [Frankiaceae bacterium]